MKRIVLILASTLITSTVSLAFAAEEKTEAASSMTSEAEVKAYFDYKLAYTLAGDFERGKQLASQAERFPRACRFCHGADGIAPGDHHPNLAGQKDKYLRSQLISFIFMQRESHIMNRTLVDFEKEQPLYSEQEIADLAFYFSSLDPTGDGKGEQPLRKTP